MSGEVENKGETSIDKGRSFFCSMVSIVAATWVFSFLIHITPFGWFFIPAAATYIMIAIVVWGLLSVWLEEIIKAFEGL